MRFFQWFAVLAAALFLQNCKNETTPQPSEAARKKMEAGLDTLTGMPIRAENPFLENTCSLLPDADFQSIFDINPSSDANQHTLKNNSYCLWVWKRPDWKERETYNDKNNDYRDPEYRLALKIVNYGTASDAAAHFESFKNGQTLTVENLGAGAIWQADKNTLVVAEKSFNILLTAEVSDVAEENLAKAKAVAMKILGNMQR